MAKSGAKKQLQENQARLTMLRNLLVFSNAWFVVGRLLIFRSSTTWSTYLAAAAMSGIQFFCFTAVTRMAGSAVIAAEPLLAANGEILDGGADLLHASIASYYQDLIYLCSLVQALSVLTDKAFWAFWLIPIVAGYLIYTSIVQPYMSQRAAAKDAPETDAEQKRREKAERKAGRTRIRTVR